MANAAAEGVRAADNHADVLFADDYIDACLRDCRTCRDDNGDCTIDDYYDDLLLNHILPADGIIIAAPIYWYALPALVKSIFDRLVCYTSAKYAGNNQVIGQLKGKRFALLLSSEESNPAMYTGIVQQVSDFAQYTGGRLVAVVNGAANTRAEIGSDPARPLEQATRVGRDLFSIRTTNYLIDTPRSAKVWQQGES